MNITTFLKELTKTDFPIFTSPAIHLDRKLHDPNFTKYEKEQLHDIMSFLFNEYLLDFYGWESEKDLREMFTKIPQRIFLDRRLPLETYVGKYFIPPMKKTAEYKDLAEKTDLRELPKKTVSELLQMELSIKDHPVFHSDHQTPVPETPNPESPDHDTPGHDTPDPESNEHTYDHGTSSDHNDPDRNEPNENTPETEAGDHPRVNQWNEFIATLAGLDIKEKQSFIENHRGQILDKKSVIKIFGGAISDSILKKLNYVKGLLELTKWNKEATESLFKLPRMTSLKDLAANTSLDWPSIMKHVKESEITGEEIEQSLAESFPTAYVTARIDKKSSAFILFLNNNPSLNIFNARTTSDKIQVYTWKGIDEKDKKAVIQDIHGFQRTKSLSQDIQQVPYLINAGYTSAHAIVNSHRKVFLKNSGIPEKAARQVYLRASKIHNESLLALNLQLEQSRNESIPFLKTRAKKGNDSDPDFQELFGTLQFCDCHHCNSIYSPAAYFVDLLYFIQSNNVDALNELKRRRPDLWKIKLNCDQTNTTQPYLELILEVLGNFMVQEASKIQGAPDNIDDILYLPWINPELPFEGHWLEAHLYAEKSEIGLAGIYQMMDVNPIYFFQEYLSLGPETLKWILKPVPLPNTSPDVYSVEQFTNLFNINHDELTALVSSKVGQWLELKTTKIDVQNYRQEVRINLSTPAQRAQYLKKVFTFLRMYRHLHFTISDLDLYLDLALINNNKYDSQHILMLSYLHYIQDSFGLTNKELTLFVKGYEEEIPDLTGILEKGDLQTLSKLLIELGISQEDFGLLVGAFEEYLEFDNGLLILNPKNISLLKRNVFWARGINVNITEWLDIVNFYEDQKLLSDHQWYKLMNQVILHQRINLPIGLFRFYLHGIESPEWKFSFSLDTLTAWLHDLQSNLKQFTDIIEWSNSAAELLSSDEDMVMELISSTVLPLIHENELDAFIDQFNQILSSEITASDPFIGEVHEILRSLSKKLQYLQFLNITSEALAYFDSHVVDQESEYSQKQWVVAIFHFAKWMDGLQNNQELFKWLFTEDLHLDQIADEIKSELQDVLQIEVDYIPVIIRVFHNGQLKLNQWNIFFNAVHICQVLNWNPSQLGLIVDTQQMSNTPRKYYKQIAEFFKQSLELSANSAEKKHEIRDNISDSFLESKRDALIALLKKSMKIDFSDTSKIYEYFLLDVETSACSDVSPIKAAILSVQLFIQRCMMNLEEGGHGVALKFDADDKKEWEWRKNYRVWEANRKVFLYPENYLDPDLRDNKTPIYKELEGDIQQRDLAMEAIEQTYRRYLKEFSVVAKLALSGSFYDSSKKLYYYFGRTQSLPYRYHYKTYKRSVREWSPWYEIDVKVDSDYLTGLVVLGKLYIFWKQTEKYIVSEVIEGTATTSNRYKHVIHYAYLQEDNNWSKPITIDAGIKASMEGLNIMDYHSGNYNLSLDDFQHDNYLYVEKASTHANCFRARLSNHIGLGTGRDHTNETDVIINYLEDKWVEKFDTHNGFDSKFLLISTKAGVEIASPNYQNLANRWNYTEHYRMNIRSGLNASTKWDSMNDSGQFLTSGNNENLSIVNGSHPSNYVIKNDEKYYQLLFGNKGMYSLNSYVVNKLSEVIFTQGLDQFLSPETQLDNKEITKLTIGSHPWAPSTILLPERGLDFKGPNGVYFEELYFHIPFSIAKHYNSHQKFKEADYWFRKIFDPTVELEGDSKYWQYAPFRTNSSEKLNDVLKDTSAIDKYHENPFNPHAIARLRTTAYPKAVVMAYIDNLVDWADHHFREDTYESINEAMMLYIMAQQLLGERPRIITPCDTANEHSTFEDLEGQMNGSSEILIEIESFLTNKKLGSYESTDHSDPVVYENHIKQSGAEDADRRRVDNSKKPGYSDPTFTKAISQELFCIPWNEVLLKYWNTIEDRMYKIRNCMNIDGKYRQLALFEPSIDPMMLVRAQAAGISLSQLTTSENILPYRFGYLLEKAKSYVQMVQGFGQRLLSVMEKADGEALLELRNIHERNILEMMTKLKEKNLEELEYGRLNLEINQEKIAYNIEHYQKLITGDIIKGFKNADRKFKRSGEIQKSAQILSFLTSAFFMLPQIGAPTAMTFGGKQIGKAGEGVVKALHSVAAIAKLAAEVIEKYQNQVIRTMGWQQQLHLYQKEQEQNELGLKVNEIKKDIAQRDLEIHEQSIRQNREITDFYADKMTSKALYDLLHGHLTRLYRDAYSLTFKIALSAQKAYQFETNNENITFLSFDNWDSASMGLMAGEKLQYQLMQMESAFMEQNIRQAEIRVPISLSILDPEALLDLKNTGTCDFKVPETWIDIQYPGQYRRKIRSVSLTLPCIVGPYTNVACKLEILESKLRINPALEEDLIDVMHLLPSGNDRMFTSSAQNDAGLLEFSYRDERYLPFEGAGVASAWRLSLPGHIRSFDYNTISDAILHVSYTAEYDETFSNQVENSILTQLNQLSDQNGLIRIISLKHEFPNEWYQAGVTEGNIRVVVEKQHFPYFISGYDIAIQSIELKSYINKNLSSVGSLTSNNQIPLEVDVSLESSDFEYDVFLVVVYRLQSI